MNRLNLPTLQKGARVQATGIGKTARYKNWRGTVANVIGDQFVYVQFDYTDTTTCLLPEEIRLETHSGCPCALCEYESKHGQ